MLTARVFMGIHTGLICLLLGGACLVVSDAVADPHTTQTKGTLSFQSGYQSGVQAYRRGDYGTAVRMFQQLLSQEPQNVNAHYYLALSLDRQHQSKAAAPEYRYVLSHGHETPIVSYAQERLASLQVLEKRAPQKSAEHVSRTAESAPASSASSSELALMASGTPSTAKVYRGAVSQIVVPLKDTRNSLMLDAVLKNGDNATVGAFILDTGATYTSISEELAEQLGLDTKHCDKVRITTANGRIDVPKVMIETLSVNGLEAHHIEATVIPVRAGSSFSGLLGLSFIRQFVLTIDPQAGQLLFRKN